MAPKKKTAMTIGSLGAKRPVPARTSSGLVADRTRAAAHEHQHHPGSRSLAAAPYRKAMISSLLFFLPESSYIELELESGGLQGAHEVGGTPPTLVERVWPSGLHLWRGFFIIYCKVFRGFPGHSENFCFLHIKQHHGNSAENSISPG